MYMFTCLNLNCKKFFYLTDPIAVTCCPYCGTTEIARFSRQSSHRRYKNYYELFDVIPKGTEYFDDKS